MSTKQSDCTTCTDDPPNKRPPTLKSLLTEAQRLQEAGDLLGAAACLEEAVALAAKNLNVRLKAIMALHAADETARARTLSMPLETWDLDEAAYSKVLKVLEMTKDKTRLELVMLRFLQQHPNHQAASVNFIKLLCDAERVPEAVERIDLILKSPDVSTVTLKQIYECQMQLKRFDDAVGTARRAVALSPSDFFLRLHLVQALRSSRHIWAIRAELPAMAELAGDNPGKWAWLADAASWAKDAKWVDEATQRALLFDNAPDKRYLRIAWANFRMGRFEATCAVLSHINLASLSDTDILIGVVTLIKDLQRIEGSKPTSSAVAAAALRRIDELDGVAGDNLSRIFGARR